MLVGVPDGTFESESLTWVVRLRGTPRALVGCEFAKATRSNRRRPGSRAIGHSGFAEEDSGAGKVSESSGNAGKRKRAEPWAHRQFELRRRSARGAHGHRGFRHLPFRLAM